MFMSWTKDPYITSQIGLMSRLFIFLLLLKKMTPTVWPACVLCTGDPHCYLCTAQGDG